MYLLRISLCPVPPCPLSSSHALISIHGCRKSIRFILNKTPRLKSETLLEDISSSVPNPLSDCKFGAKLFSHVAPRCEARKTLGPVAAAFLVAVALVHGTHGLADHVGVAAVRDNLVQAAPRARGRLAGVGGEAGSGLVLGVRGAAHGHLAREVLVEG